MDPGIRHVDPRVVVAQHEPHKVSRHRKNASERMREDFARDERSIKNLALIYLANTLVTASVLSAYVTQPDLPFIEERAGWLFLCWFLALSWLNIQLFRIHPASRTPTLWLSLASVLSFPIGTILSGITLFKLTSEDGRFLFSYEYWRSKQETAYIVIRPSLFWLLVCGPIILAGFLMTAANLCYLSPESWRAWLAAPLL